jgi:hypothetical protein
MNTSSDIKIEKPKIIQALLSGFETIANNIYLILLPILLDLFLWFGPNWRVDAFFKPLIDGLSQLQSLEGPEYAGMLETYQSIWQEAVSSLNLAVTLRTLPVGLPSLMASKPAFLNPVGRPLIFSLESSMEVFGFWALFMLIGFLLGSIYYQRISNSVLELTSKNQALSFIQTLIQVLLMPVVLLVILLILSIPVMFLVTLISLISPGIAQFMTAIASIIVLWILLPLIFTPHGVFLFKQNLIAAMMTSISVVRVSLTKTALFILTALVMVEGLNYLWRRPPVDHWLLLVGILGHAFIVSGVIASSFHYYLDAARFTQTVMNKQSDRKMPFKNMDKME